MKVRACDVIEDTTYFDMGQSFHTKITHFLANANLGWGIPPQVMSQIVRAELEAS